MGKECLGENGRFWGLHMLPAARCSPGALAPPGMRLFIAVTWGRDARSLLPIQEGEEEAGCSSHRHTALLECWHISFCFLLSSSFFFFLIFSPPKPQPMSSPSAVSAMLPRKAEKRMASSVFITLASPRRETAPREQPQAGVSLAVPEGTPRPPVTPALPNGGEEWL